MEAFAVCTFAFLVSSCAATVVVALPFRLAVSVSVVLAIAAIVVWSEWVKRSRPTDDFEQYGPLFSLVLGAIIGGFWA